MATITPVQRIQRAHIQIMRSPQFALMTGVVMCGRYTIDKNTPTAYTDGWNVTYGEKFIGKLDEKELVFLVLHENMHKMLRQLTTWKRLFKQDARRANMAADYVVNGMIVDMDPGGRVCVPPQEALLDHKYRGMDTREVFDALGRGGSGQGDGPPEDGAPGDGPMDSHEWGSDEGISAEEQEARGKAMDVAVRQGLLAAKAMGDGVPRSILDAIEPKVNWREALREFMDTMAAGSTETSWRRPNRRYLATGAYMPSMYSEAMGEIVVAIDTSGSIGGKELTEFASELVSICETARPSKVTLLWWDTSVRGVQVFEGDYSGILASLKPAGGGGTDYACVGAYLAQEQINPLCIVTLTDGYIGDWGVPAKCPTLFAITSREVAPYGVTVRVEVQ